MLAATRGSSSSGMRNDNGPAPMMVGEPNRDKKCDACGKFGHLNNDCWHKDGKGDKA